MATDFFLSFTFMLLYEWRSRVHPFPLNFSWPDDLLCPIEFSSNDAMPIPGLALKGTGSFYFLPFEVRCCAEGWLSWDCHAVRKSKLAMGSGHVGEHWRTRHTSTAFLDLRVKLRHQLNTVEWLALADATWSRGTSQMNLVMRDLWKIINYCFKLLNFGWIVL